MYKLIIVEDESQMNYQLTRILDWENIGFEIVATFENGADAIEYINQNHVDAVLTDIRVPMISGVELSKICHTEHPQIKFVFISAYRNFEYARSAIKYNVVDYVTKPITYNEFFNAMVSLYNEVDKINHISALQKRNDFIEDEIAFMRQEYLSSYILGVIETDTLVKHLEQIGMKFDRRTSPCAQINIKINDFDNFINKRWKHQRDRFYSTINKFVTPENDFAYFSVSQFIYDSIDIIVIGKQQIPETVFNSIIDDYFKLLCANMKSLLDIDVTVSKLQVVPNLDTLKKYRVHKDSAQDFSAMVMSYIHNDCPAEAVKTVRIVRKIYANNTSEAEKFCQHLFSEISAMFPKSDSFRVDFLSLTDVNQMFDFFIDRIAELRRNDNSPECIMEKAIAFINEHFCENLTLTDVANTVALSSGYFSSIFKQNTGEKFIDYLSRLRINKACDLLLNSNIKITAIANLVGYKDAQYFHRVFKLYTGTTPSQYRYKTEQGV